VQPPLLAGIDQCTVNFCFSTAVRIGIAMFDGTTQAMKLLIEDSTPPPLTSTAYTL
jgi:hypothetical protein